MFGLVLACTSCMFGDGGRLVALFRNGWGASAVDAFSTALVMGNWDVVEKILDYIPKIDFNTTTTEVSLFETTIRYLGGLVSGKA